MRTGEIGVSPTRISPTSWSRASRLSGGVYPITAVCSPTARRSGSTKDGFGHISTFGGAELGCVAAIKTLEITTRPEVRSNVHAITDLFGVGLAASRSTIRTGSSASGETVW